MFKPGDSVKCIDDSPFQGSMTKELILHRTYTVDYMSKSGCVRLIGVSNGWLPDRFELVDPPTEVEIDYLSITKDVVGG